jgi:hypothetical protein
MQRRSAIMQSHNSLFSYKILGESTNHTQGIFRGLTLVAR